MNDFDLYEIEDRLVRLFSSAVYLLENNIFDDGLDVSKTGSYNERALLGATLSLITSVEFYREKLACVQEEVKDILSKKPSIEVMDISENRRKDLERAFVAAEIVSQALEREKTYVDGYSAKLKDLLMVDHRL